MKIRHEYPPYPGRPGCRRSTSLFLATVLVSLGCVFGGSAIHAKAVTHSPPPPTPVYRWFNQDNSLCSYDRNTGNPMNMGGCTSATRWSRTDCGNRTVGQVTLYYCAYKSQATGGYMTVDETTSKYLYTFSVNNGAVALFSDPGPGVINLWELQHGNNNYNMETDLGSGSLILMAMGGAHCCGSWGLLSG